MGKDGAGLHVTQRQRSGGQWFALAIAHNFDYVICCGIKALGKLGKASGKMSFLAVGAGYYLKMLAAGFFSLFFYYICAMDFWTIIGTVSSVLGIFSFLKNDVLSLISPLKKDELVSFSGQEANIKKTFF